LEIVAYRSSNAGVLCVISAAVQTNLSGAGFDGHTCRSVEHASRYQPLGASRFHFAWKFEPVQKHVEVNPGQTITVNYRVTNTLAQPSTGRAVPSFAPMEAGSYFQKIECFCFSNQTLAAGETREMPITFYVDPKLPKDIGAIALSYTFFSVEDGVKKL
jgi:cytochrome c oxidase assembly protein Cox11